MLQKKLLPFKKLDSDPSKIFEEFSPDERQMVSHAAVVTLLEMDFFPVFWPVPLSL